MTRWKRVLIIDDKLETVDYITYFLGKANMSVSCARTTEDGMGFVLEYRPDLIVCDIHIPDGGRGNGFEFVRWLRSDARVKMLPCVALTDLQVSKVDEAAAIKAGFDGYLRKPLDPWKLADQLKAFIK